MLTRHRSAQPDAVGALKSNAASQYPSSSRPTRTALGARDTNLLVELAAPLSLGGRGAPLKQTVLGSSSSSSSSSSRSSKLAKLSSRVASLVAVVAAESEAAKENPAPLPLHSFAQPLDDAQQQPTTDDAQSHKENNATADDDEEEETEDATDRAWIEMNKQVTPMKRRERRSVGKTVGAAGGSSSARKSLAAPSSAASSHVHYTDLHTAVLNDVAPTPFTAAAAARKSLSLTPTPASTATATSARARRRRSSTKGAVLKFASSTALATENTQLDPAAMPEFAEPASLTVLGGAEAEEFGASIPDEPSISDNESEAPAATTSTSRAMPTVCLTPTSYERRARKSNGASAASSRAPHTRKSDRRSLHHTQLQLLKQLVAEDEQTELQMQQELQQHQQSQGESGESGVVVVAEVEPASQPAVESVDGPAVSPSSELPVSAPMEPEPQVQSPASPAPALATAKAEASVTEDLEIRPIICVIPAPLSPTLDLMLVSPAVVEPQAEMEPSASAPILAAADHAAVDAAVVRASPKRFASSARKARSMTSTTPSAGPTRRVPATAARKSLFDASARDEDAAASLFSSGLMRLTFHAGTPPATPAGLGMLLTTPESAHKRKSARNSISVKADLDAAETESAVPSTPTPLAQSTPLHQITGRSPARRRSLQAREQGVGTEEPVIGQDAGLAEAAMEEPVTTIVAAENDGVAEAELLGPAFIAPQETEAVENAQEQQQERADAGAPVQLSTPMRSRRSQPPSKQCTPAAVTAVLASTASPTPRRSPLRSAIKQLSVADAETVASPQTASPIPSSFVRSTRSTPVHAAVAAADPMATVSPQQTPSESSAPLQQAQAARRSPKRFAASSRKARSLAPTTPSALAAAAAAPSRRAPATASRKSLFDASMRDEAAAASLFTSGLLRLSFHAATPPDTPAGLSCKPLLTSPEQRKSTRSSIAQEAVSAAEPLATPCTSAAPQVVVQITDRSPARRRSLQAREQEGKLEPDAEPAFASAIIEDLPVTKAAVAVADAVSPVRSPVRSSPRTSPVRATVVAAAVAAVTPAVVVPIDSPAHPQPQQRLSPALSPSKRSRRSLLTVVATRFARRGAPHQGQEIPDAILQRLFTATKESLSPVQLSPRSSNGDSAGSSRAATPEKPARAPRRKHMNTPVPVPALLAMQTTSAAAATVATPPSSSAESAAAAAATPSPPRTLKAASSRRRSKRSPVAVAAGFGARSARDPTPSGIAEPEAIAVEPEQPSVLSFVRGHPIQCAAVVVSFMGAAAALCYLL